MPLCDVIAEMIYHTLNNGNKIYVSYCVSCMDEYNNGQRDTVAFKLNHKGFEYKITPPDNMRKYVQASGCVCTEHMIATGKFQLIDGHLESTRARL
jgi:hypothetical protein